MTHEHIYELFRKQYPSEASRVLRYDGWGGSSIIVWYGDGTAHKVKLRDNNRICIQQLTEEDIKKKYNGGI